MSLQSSESEDGGIKDKTNFSSYEEGPAKSKCILIFINEISPKL